jgi:hypothetical protein
MKKLYHNNHRLGDVCWIAGISLLFLMACHDEPAPVSPPASRGGIKVVTKPGATGKDAVIPAEEVSKEGAGVPAADTPSPKPTASGAPAPQPSLPVEVPSKPVLGISAPVDTVVVLNSTWENTDELLKNYGEFSSLTQDFNSGAPASNAESNPLSNIDHVIYMVFNNSWGLLQEGGNLKIVNYFVEADQVLNTVTSMLGSGIGGYQLRANSHKNIIIVSDANGDTASEATALKNKMISLQSSSGKKMFFSAIVSLTGTSSLSWCSPVAIGSNYRNISGDAIKGVVADICQDSWRPIFRDIGKAVFNEILTVKYAFDPQKVGQTPTVMVNGKAATDYRIEGNQVVFEGTKMPNLSDIVIIK